MLCITFVWMVSLFYLIQNAFLYHPNIPCKYIFCIHALLNDLLNHCSALSKTHVVLHNSCRHFHLIPVNARKAVVSFT